MPSTINATPTSSGLVQSADASGVLALQTGGTTAVTINVSQNVGIGTSSPTGKLDVVSGSSLVGRFFNNAGRGQVAVDGTSDSSFVIRRNGTQIGWIQSDSSGLEINTGTSGAHPYAFYTNNTERMRITATGELILAGSTAQKATGTTWSNPSDQRLKDNIRDYEKGIDELMQVRVREWEYNGKGGTVDGTKGLGVVADEIMVVLPSTVENYEAKLNADDEEVTAIKKFDATEITWLLVKTVQEQQALIEALTTRLTTLENK